MSLLEAGIEIDKSYRHYKNEKIYYPKQWCQIQEDGKWVDAVMYEAALSGPTTSYIRSITEFKQKFKRAFL